MGNAENRHFGNLRQLRDALFDFRRIDIFTAADDHVVLAVTQVVVPFFVEEGHISCGHPFAVDGLPGFFRILIVAAEGGARLCPEHPGLVRLSDRVALFVHKFDFDARVRLPDAAHFSYLVPVPQGGQGAGFRRAVPLAEPGFFEELDGFFFGSGHQRSR